MKIIIINKSYFAGGAGIAAGRLFKSLIRLGVDVKMMVFDKTEREDANLIKITRSFIDTAVWWFHFVLERIFFLLYERNKKFRFSFSPAVSGIDISDNREVKRADLMHLHWFNQGFLSLNSLHKLAKMNKPLAFTLHDMWAFTGGCHYTDGCTYFTKQCGNCKFLRKPSETDLSNWGIKRKERLYESKKITFITCSQWLKDEAKKSFLLGASRIEVIPNSIDTSFYSPLENKNELRKALDLPVNKKLVLFGAQNLADARKGLKYFLEAIRHVENSCQLIVFGKNTQLVLVDEKFKVYNFGSISNSELMKQLYQIADVFVLPSLQDNLPNTVMESMACGTPVVAFNTGGLPEMIEHHKNGYIAEYLSSIDLAAGVDWIIENNSDNALSVAAREKVLNDYSEDVIAQKHIELYKSMLNEHSS